MTLYLALVTLLVASSIAAAQPPSPTPIATPEITSTAQPELPTLYNTGDKPERVATPDVPALIRDSYVPPTAAARRKRFINSTVGPLALGKMVATAGISTWTNSPEEWGTQWEGFGRRVASNFGKNAIKQTTVFGLDEAFKLDSHFYRSKTKGFGARFRNAVISPVTARDRNGKRVFGFPRIAGTYGSNIIAYEAWYPDRYGWKDGVRSGTISLGFNAAFNLFKEFVWKK